MHAVQLAADTRSSLIMTGSPDSAHGLTARHPDVPDVAGFHEQLRDYFRKAAPARLGDLCMTASSGITFQLGRRRARPHSHLGELRALYTEVYAEPPYGWGQDHADLFAERFEVQRRQAGFALVEARDGADYRPAPSASPSSRPPRGGTTSPPPAARNHHRTPRPHLRPGRNARPGPWRRQHIAQGMHDLLLQRPAEERATLTVLPAPPPAQAAYLKWGWPGSPRNATRYPDHRCSTS